MLVYGQDREIAAWVAERIPHVREFSECAGIGVISGDRLLAGIVYHDYQSAHGTIQLSMAAVSPMWARKETIKELLKHPFEELKCYKVWTATPIENEAALRVNAHIGFKREAILAHQFGKKRHAVIMRILRPDYDRLFGEKNGQIST